MLTKEPYVVDSKTSFDVEIAAAPSGKVLPLVVVVHGNFGLGGTFGQQLRNFTEQVARLGFVAALPTYYPGGVGNVTDSDIKGKLPALKAAIAHLSKRADVDASRLGLVGFSLGGGISMAFINAMPKGTVRAFANFYGYVAPLLGEGVDNFPPTIVFHNKHDRMVEPVLNSEPLIDALIKAKVVHEPAGAPYDWYDEHWQLGRDHAFEPDKHADQDSRRRAGEWLVEYV
jgi:carboxymethylenebutenolidase